MKTRARSKQAGKARRSKERQIPSTTDLGAPNERGAHDSAHHAARGHRQIIESVVVPNQSSRRRCFLIMVKSRPGAAQNCNKSVSKQRNRGRVCLVPHIAGAAGNYKRTSLRCGKPVPGTCAHKAGHYARRAVDLFNFSHRWYTLPQNGKRQCVF